MSEENVVTTFDPATGQLQQNEVAVPQQSTPASGQAPAQNRPNSEADSQETDTSNVEDGGNPDEPQKRGKNWAARKIDDLTRRLNKAEEEKLHALRIAQAVSEGRPPNPNAPQAPNAPSQPGQSQAVDGVPLEVIQRVIGPPPSRDQFEDFEAYLEARSEYRADAKLAARDLRLAAAQRQQQIESKGAELAQKATQAVEKFASSVPDYEEVTSRLDFSPPPAMLTAILDSDEAGALFYALGQNPEEARRIASMRDPVAIAKAIGRIEAGLVQPPQITNAPAPAKTVGSSRASNIPPYRDDFTPEEHMDWMKKYGSRRK